MKKEADKERGSRGIGLATEHRLPEAFKARTDDDAGTVEIKKHNSRPLNVAINSFASVSNLLSVFSPDGETSLEPGHTIKIIDEFNDRSVTITANAFVDAAAAMQTFVVSRGKYLPSAPEAAPVHAQPERASRKAPKRAAPAAAETTSGPTAHTAEATKPSGKQTKKAPARKGAAATASKAAAQQPEAAAGGKAKTSKPAAAKAAPKQTPKPAAPKTVPAWAKSLPSEHVDSDGGFRLDSRTLALTRERAKTVEGVSDGTAEHEAFGYEVSEGTAPGGRHVGYVIVEDPRSWVVTGFGEIPPTKHANLNAAAIRIRVTNLPRLRGA